MITRCIFLTALIFGMCWVSFGQYTSPTDSGTRIHKVAPTTRPWYEPDGSLESLNAGCNLGNSAGMIRIMKEGLVGEQCPLASTLPGTKKYITRISEALHRSGDSPEITNTLHRALLTPKNLYLDIILHAYIMASPVPMTFLAETVVKEFPAGQRKAWYAAAGEKALYGNSWEDSLLDRPSREVLRYSHFLNRAKALETDPECLRVIGNPFDPGREAFPTPAPGGGKEGGERRVAPNGAAQFISWVAPTARPWYEADDSLRTVNARLAHGRDGGMIGLIGAELLSRDTPLARTSEGTSEYVAELLGILWRNGDSPEITNILHQALLAPTNHYREATFRAYVMASPVPMTVLAETVVKSFPLEERKAWYARSGSKKLKTHSWIDRSIDRPSRESLRYSHFLNRVKVLETDPDCLRIIGDIVDPKWECQQERKDEK
ncbi:MAG: hypothetical protein PHG74_07375 [Kiritimatiellae bacterium]|jgi:hypothetical protein|nr:hypothetical protein [Kiritimatiellia bacterium]MDD3583821.1 hypothetical protein [Kiritimatiellia bacterium]